MKTIEVINQIIGRNFRHALGEFDELTAEEIAAWVGTGSRTIPSASEIRSMPAETILNWAVRRLDLLYAARLSEYREDGPSDATLDELSAAIDEFKVAMSTARRRGDYRPLRMIYAAEHGLRGADIEQAAGTHSA